MARRIGRVRIHSAPMEAPWTWMALGWRDLWSQPRTSLGYGAVFVALGLAVSAGLWRLGLSAAIPAAAGAFALIAPVLALRLYAGSRRSHATSLGSGVTVVPPARSRIQLAYVGFALLFILLVWARVAQLLFALFITGDYLPLHEFTAFALTTQNGLIMVALGSVIGAGLAFCAFAISAVSLPLLAEHEIDAGTAMIVSIAAIKENPGPMLLWAWIIAVTTAVGSAAALVGLAVAFPLLGHATWHAYRALVSVDPLDAPALSAKGSLASA